MIHLSPYDAADQGAVTAFKGPNCTKRSVRFALEGLRRSVRKEEMEKAGMGNNLMRSIMVPHGYYVRLMKDDHCDYQESDYITIQGSEYRDD